MRSSIMLSALFVASIGVTAEAGQPGCMACGGVAGNGNASECLTCQNIWDGYCESKPPCLGAYGIHHGGSLLGARCGGHCGGHCGGCCAAGGVGIYGHGQCGCRTTCGPTLFTGLFHKIKHRVRGTSCCDDTGFAGGCQVSGCDGGCSSSAGCQAGQHSGSDQLDPAWTPAPAQRDSAELNDVAPIPPEAPAPMAPDRFEPPALDDGAEPPVPPTPPTPELESAASESSAFHWLQPHLRKLLRN